MIGSRWLLFAMSTLAGTVWAGWLVVVGLCLIWAGMPQEPSALPRVPLGVFFIAGGQFVFLVLVADRVFRRALTAGRAAMELVVAAIMTGALVGAISSVV